MTRTITACLLLLALFVAFPAGHAVAQEDCNPSGTASVVQDLELAESTEPVAEEKWQLPVGALSAEDLERAFREVQRSGKGIMGFFGLLADGQKRQLDGATVRAMFEKYGVELEFLPLDALEGVVSQDGKVTFAFDFGDQSERELQLPESRLQVLDSRHRSDRFLVDRKNRVREQKSDGKKLRLKDELQLTVNENGLTGVRQGDLAVHHWLLGWVDLQVHSERHDGKIATGDKERPVLETDGRGKPLVVDGHYVPQRFDDWVIITAKGRRIEVGIPPLASE